LLLARKKKRNKKGAVQGRWSNVPPLEGKKKGGDHLGPVMYNGKYGRRRQRIASEKRRILSSTTKEGGMVKGQLNVGYIPGR